MGGGMVGRGGVLNGGFWDWVLGFEIGGGLVVGRVGRV